MSFSTMEQQIVAEYGVVIGFIKNYAVPCTVAALVVGLLIGHFI